MKSAILAALLLAAPALGLAKTTLITPPAPTQAVRWLLTDDTPEITGGVGLTARLPAGGGDKVVGEVGCVRPTGFYVGADGFNPRPGVAALTLRLDGGRFDLPLLPHQSGPRVEAFGPTPAGLLDALQATHTVQLAYGDQASPLLAAPDPLVTDAFLAVCRKIEGDHGQGG